MIPTEILNLVESYRKNHGKSIEIISAEMNIVNIQKLWVLILDQNTATSISQIKISGAVFFISKGVNPHLWMGTIVS